MFRRRKKRSFQNDTAFVLAGAAIGGFVALLYAPKTGVEFRRDIKDEVGNAVGQIKQTATEIKGNTVRAAADLMGKAGEILTLSRNYVSGSYRSTSGSIVSEIAHLRTAINAAVDAYKTYNQHPVSERMPRVNNVFTSTDVSTNDEELPKFEGMGRRQD